MYKILYIDMDGVIADYYHAPSKDFSRKGHFINLKPIVGGIEAVEILDEYFDIYFLSTAPWSAPDSWKEKRLWIEKYFPKIGFKKLILSHNKGLLRGDFLVDDRIMNGVDEFDGEHIHFGNDKFKNWDITLKYLMSKI